jgi:hypothetical protein
MSNRSQPPSAPLMAFAGHVNVAPDKCPCCRAAAAPRPELAEVREMDLQHASGRSPGRQAVARALRVSPSWPAAR